MFKCEDEMFEFDMLVESVKATIKNLYSKLGVDDIVDAMRKNPLGTLPFILRELEQEYEKLARRRCDKNKDWTDVPVLCQTPPGKVVLSTQRVLQCQLEDLDQVSFEY
ncbi:hypothetical protein F8388_008748 [Cannabis sativa]|uniref:Histone deacetylase interacting domain-containing protein n=1 Tax=Cannabis sativa TaxID=3483 RepID=A0A7J6HLU9_CANSA|nr:hypothetical protein F8388_008748 [Cannabis sativa]